MAQVSKIHQCTMVKQVLDVLVSTAGADRGLNLVSGNNEERYFSQYMAIATDHSCLKRDLESFSKMMDGRDLESY